MTDSFTGAVNRIRRGAERACETTGELIIDEQTGVCGDPEGAITEALSALSAEQCRKIKKIKVWAGNMRTPPDILARFVNITALDFSYTDIAEVPQWICEMPNLTTLEIEGTLVEQIPPVLLHKNIEVDARRTKAANPPAGQYHHVYIKRVLYKYLYSRLDALQKRVNPCGWENGQCVRAEKHCCKTEYVCKNLTEQGCPAGVRSISCKLWLCDKALENTARVIAAGGPRARNAKLYLRLRERAALLLEKLQVPLKIRASAGETFDPSFDDYINTKIPHWFDGKLLAVAGYFPRICRQTADNLADETVSH